MMNDMPVLACIGNVDKNGIKFCVYMYIYK